MRSCGPPITGAHLSSDNRLPIRGASPERAALGQAEYEVVFLEMGALFVLGLAFLAGYSTIFLAAAAIAASFRKRSSNETGEES